MIKQQSNISPTFQGSFQNKGQKLKNQLEEQVKSSKHNLKSKKDDQSDLQSMGPSSVVPPLDLSMNNNIQSHIDINVLNQYETAL